MDEEVVPMMISSDSRSAAAPSSVSDR